MDNWKRRNKIHQGLATMRLPAEILFCSRLNVTFRKYEKNALYISSKESTLVSANWQNLERQPWYSWHTQDQVSFKSRNGKDPLRDLQDPLQTSIKSCRNTGAGTVPA